MSIVLCSSDLMTSSRVEGAAQRVGTGYESSANIADAHAKASAQGGKLLLVDLTNPALDLEELATLIESRRPSAPPVVAFGPHVLRERLEGARKAGCDTVLTRGQFFAEIDEIVRQAHVD